MDRKIIRIDTAMHKQHKGGDMVQQSVSTDLTEVVNPSITPKSKKDYLASLSERNGMFTFTEAIDPKQVDTTACRQRIEALRQGHERRINGTEEPEDGRK
jgi:hypothetical protein